MFSHKWITPLISVFWIMASVSAGCANQATDLVFSTGVLDNIAPQTEVIYRHQRSGTASKSFHPVSDGEITLQMQSDPSGKEVLVSILENGKLHSQTSFPADAGNPLVMAFLEYTLRSMAATTGGSPFYLRNRIKDSLRSKGEVSKVTVTLDGKPVMATDVVFRPFQDDPNAPKMGDFSKLELHFVVTPSVPGGFVRFQAATPDRGGKPLYHETIEYSTLAKQE